MLTIAIDGPAGSGKSSAAAGLAKLLGINHFNTGVMYRGFAYLLLSKGISDTDMPAILAELKDLRIDVDFIADSKQVTSINGRPLHNEVYSEQVTKMVALISHIPAVREFMKKKQLEVAKNYDVIVEGRDITSYVLPNAKYKFFVTASLETRARRDMEKVNKNGGKVTYKQALASVMERDNKDTHREVGALKLTKDAIYINTDKYSVDEVVAIMYSHIKERPHGIIF